MSREIAIHSEITGAVAQVSVQVGSQVAVDDVLVMIEAMKMEIPVASPVLGKVSKINVKEGDTVSEGEILIVLEVD
ncbi:MAG: biotin/lipoyl-containing protein [Limnohabitans sp.]|jgi:biotin carboxyl carrier protein